jgi:hypothetical protein
MTGIKSVHASAAADAAPVFVLAGGWLEVFEGNTGSEFTTMFILDNSGHGTQWHQPHPELTLVDDLEDDVAAGLAALKEPVVATWESVKDRLGL